VQKYGHLTSASLTKPLNSGAEASGLCRTWPAHASCHTVPDSHGCCPHQRQIAWLSFDDESAMIRRLEPMKEMLLDAESGVRPEDHGNPGRGRRTAKKSQADLIDRITRMEAADYSTSVPRRANSKLCPPSPSMERQYGNYKRDTDKLH
uniref:Reverse transcriptase domain-containing protein n=1 Tax=Macrostomum lignano TaxID=282301 RepID=A0A1I8JQ26_9PLAT